MAAQVAKAKVLAVGAGGIGCELLKTLVLSGFRDIEVVRRAGAWAAAQGGAARAAGALAEGACWAVAAHPPDPAAAHPPAPPAAHPPVQIDLDTIETSNLNRQFLFRRRHVGRSKSEVAAEAVRALRPGVSIRAYCANVKEPRFGADFFRGFDIVMNGLDNLEARRHVNRLCLAAGVPLIESGSAGYLGQVSVHRGGATECFECQPKPVPKSYPVCTLTSFPSRPIHCVVWAKDMLYQRLFGSPEAVSDLDQAAAEEGEGSAASAAQFYQRREGEGSGAYALRVLRRLFSEDVQDLLVKKAVLWQTRTPPTPLDLPAAEALASAAAPPAAANGSGNGAAAAGGGGVSRGLGLGDAHAQWDLGQSAAVFVAAVVGMLEGRPAEVGSAAFDKDDDLAVDFVTAAANLRSMCFGIPHQSLFDTKGMAGNIVHAIATTNAIISGLIAAEAMKLLAGERARGEDACSN